MTLHMESEINDELEDDLRPQWLLFEAWRVGLLPDNPEPKAPVPNLNIIKRYEIVRAKEEVERDERSYSARR